jgi:hypothetical protein
VLLVVAIWSGDLFLVLLLLVFFVLLPMIINRLVYLLCKKNRYEELASVIESLNVLMNATKEMTAQALQMKME